MLVCRECKISARTEGRGFYSVLYCLNKNHSKPSHSDVMRAFYHYIPGFDSTWISAPDDLAANWYNSIPSKRQRQHRGVKIRKNSQNVPSVFSIGPYRSSNGSCQSQNLSNTEELSNDEMNFYRHKLPKELYRGVSQFWNNLNNIDKG